MVPHMPGECHSRSDPKRSPVKEASFFFWEVSIIGHAHTAHIGSRQRVHNEIDDLMLQCTEDHLLYSWN